MKKWLFLTIVLLVCAMQYLYAGSTEVFPLKDRQYYFLQGVRYETIPGPSHPGTEGDETYDENFRYFCVAPNTWAKVAIGSWASTGDTMIYENGDTMLFEDGNTMIYD